MVFNYGLLLHHKPVKSQPPRRSSSSQAARQTQNVQCQSRLVADLLTDEVPNPRMPKRGTQQRRLKSLDRKQPHGLLLSRLSTAVAKLLQDRATSRRPCKTCRGLRNYSRRTEPYEQRSSLFSAA